MNMEMRNFFTKLRELGNLTDKVDSLEQEVHCVLKRDTRNLNILDCPVESRKTVESARKETKKLSADALKIHHDLKTVGLQTSKLMSNADVVLSYVEKETMKLETHLEGLGFIPLEKMQFIGRKKDAVETETTDHAKDNSVDVKTDDHCSESAVQMKKEVTPENNFSLDLPPTPELKNFIPSYNEKKYVDLSPVSPKLNLPSEASAHDKRLPEDLSTEGRRFFSNPHSDAEGSPNVEITLAGSKLPAPHFPPINTSPQTPVLKLSNHYAWKNTEPQDSPDGFTLHTRRSVLRDLPEEKVSIDDDTVNLLRSRPYYPNVVTPESPQISEYRLPNIKGGETKKFFENENEICTPPSPELTSRLGPIYHTERKENINPSSEKKPIPFIKITESQYDLLPEYLKRLLPLDLTNECLEKVLKNTSSLPGDKYSQVITQSRIEEVTELAGKTKSLIFLLITVKMIKKINGTDYFEILA